MPSGTIEYVPGMRLGVSSILTAFRIVARLVAEFGPRIRAAFPEATALIAFLSALESAAALLIAAEQSWDEVKSPGGENDAIDWTSLPGRIIETP